MSLLPHVADATRERVAREFDDRGPEVCCAEILADLQENNAELLDMATRWAHDVGDPARILTGFCIFYRLLTAEADASPLQVPTVSLATRAEVLRRIEAQGSKAFMSEALTDLEDNNPALLAMAHNFAAKQVDYNRVIQGLVLMYACLLLEALSQRVLH